MPAERPLRICIDARLEDGVAGGVQQEIMGLASGLSRLGASEEYHFLVHQGASGWLEPHLGGPCRLLVVPRPAPPDPGRVRRAVLALIPGRLYDAAIRSPLGRLVRVAIPHADPVLARLSIEVAHLAIQSGFLTDIPSIYAPQDLQHLHLPELFTPLARKSRALFYPTLCRQARYVVALSRSFRGSSSKH